MAQPEPIYSRLTRRKHTWSGYTQLWLGANHILLVKSTHFAEDYRRFALSDIQSIVVTGLAERRVLQVAGVLAAMAWMSGMLAVDSHFARILLGVTGAFALLLVIADIARGPRCACHVQTAVSREVLAPVSRLRQAAKFLARIQPAIEAVQGILPPDLADRPFSSAPAPDMPRTDRPPDLELPRGHAAEILFGLILADALLVFLDQRFPRTEAGSVLFVTMLAEFVLAATVLVRAGTQNLKRLIPSLAMIALLCIAWDASGVIRSVGRWGMEAAATMQQGKTALSTYEWTPSSHEVLFAGLWRMAVGLIGLTGLYFERKEART